MVENDGSILDILVGIESLKSSIENLDEKYIKKSGIICPKCTSHNSHVTDTRESTDNFKVRRRECYHCGFKWNTEEIVSNRGCW